METEEDYDWEEYLCILLDRERDLPNVGYYITIDNSDIVNLKKIDKFFATKLDSIKNRFFKLRFGIKAGTMWTKILDYDFEDYQRLLSNNKLKNKLKTVIGMDYKIFDLFMKSELRELQINKIV